MTKFVAEVSSNHNRDIDRSIEFIEMAHSAGFDAVKFQLFKVEQLFSPEALHRRPELLARSSWELPLEFIPVLSRRARALGMEFSCTPFYLDAVDELIEYCDFLKVASYELLWSDLIAKCAGTGLPLVISTGMATMHEVEEAVSRLYHVMPEVDLTILHAVSAYPTPPSECNLASIETLRDRFGVKVGWSDHTNNEYVIGRAVHKYRANMVELHVDLDGQGFEFVSGHCWLPEDCKKLIAGLRLAVAADGSPKKEPAESEYPDREWRADPRDGLRPLSSMRVRLIQER
jgi:sialic acid synthase SpsE